MKTDHSILDLIGDTPIVRLGNFETDALPPLYAKLESANPGGSSKDRVAKLILQNARESRQLPTGSTIVVAAEGNLGISLAMLAGEFECQCICVTPESVTEEKISLMRALGARVVVTPAQLSTDHPASFVKVARQMSAELDKGYFVEPYENPAFLESHYRSTGAEIWQQMNGKISAYVAPIASAGTLCGVGRYLKEKDPGIKVIGVEPLGSAYAKPEANQQPFHTRLDGVGSTTIRPLFDAAVVDDIRQISDRVAISHARELARSQGILVGGSSGLALAGALEYRKTAAQPGSAPIVILFADSGTRYLSTIFDDRWMHEAQFGGEDSVHETLNDLLGSEIRPALIFAYENENVDQAVAKLSAAGVSQLPVLTRDEQLVGITTEFRLLEYLLNQKDEGASQTTLTDANVIDEDVPTLDRDMPIDDVLNLFSQHQTAIIMEDDPFTGKKRVSGILTQIDLLDYLAKR